MKKELKPDFLQIPYQLVIDKNLSPSDKVVYGAIYFFSKMRGEACFASNKTIGELIKITSKTVSRSLNNLEEHEYIILNYEDVEFKNNRTEIIPLISMGRLTRNGGAKRKKTAPRNGGTPSPKQGNPLPETGEGKKQAISEKIDEKKLCISKKTESVDNLAVPEKRERTSIKNNNIEPLVSPSGVPNCDSFSSKNIADHLIIKGKKFSDKIKELEKGEKEVIPDMVNEAIASFLTLYPLQFVGGQKPFAIKPTRNAIKQVLSVHTFKEFQEVIEKYTARKEDKFIPQAMNIFAFCKKFETIVTYFKKNGGLWAHRSISSPEHKAEFNSRVQEMTDERRKHQADLEAEWEEKNKLN